MAQAQPPRIVEAPGFVLRDGEGRVRADLELIGGEARLRMLDQNGRTRFTLARGALWWSDENEVPHAILMPEALVFQTDPKHAVVKLQLDSTGAGELMLFNHHSNSYVRLNAEGPVMTLTDGERFSAELGSSELLTTRTGATEKRSAASLALFGKDSKVLWEAP